MPLLPPQEQRSMRSDDENHGSYRRSTALLTHPQVEPPMPSAQTPTTIASARDRRGAALPWCAPRSSHARRTPWSSSRPGFGLQVRCKLHPGGAALQGSQAVPLTPPPPIDREYLVAAPAATVAELETPDAIRRPRLGAAPVPFVDCLERYR